MYILPLSIWNWGTSYCYRRREVLRMHLICVTQNFKMWSTLVTNCERTHVTHTSTSLVLSSSLTFSDQRQRICPEILEKFGYFLEIATPLYLIGSRSCNSSYVTLASGTRCPCQLVVPISYCSINGRVSWRLCSQSDAVFSQDSCVTCFCLLHSVIHSDFSLFFCPTKEHLLKLWFKVLSNSGLHQRQKEKYV